MGWNQDARAIEELDLSPIKNKLSDVTGEGWSPEHVNAVEAEYRRFLQLISKFPDEQVAPPDNDIDIFWHHHILNTMKYAADCQQVFGRFVHHLPYLSSEGADDIAAHTQIGQRTRMLYKQIFGEACAQDGADVYCALPSKTAEGAAFRKSVYCAVTGAAYSANVTPAVYCALTIPDSCGQEQESYCATGKIANGVRASMAARHATDPT